MSADETRDDAGMYDEQILEQLREWRATVNAPTELDGHRWTHRLMLTEIDALLRIAADRDRLRDRAFHGMAEPVSETPEPSLAEAARRNYVRIVGEVLTVGQAAARPRPVVAPTPTVPDHPVNHGGICRWCQHYIVRYAGGWKHVDPQPCTSYHPAEPNA